MYLSIDNKEYSGFHFTGILGSGMSAIAWYLAKKGFRITGSDRRIFGSGREKSSLMMTLESAGCTLFPQDGSGISHRSGCVVISTAVESDNPDITSARDHSIPVFHRSDILASIIQTKRTIAVAGTSGKSSVTGMVYHILESAGLSPSLITGAQIQGLPAPGNSYAGEGDLLVIEADESDGTCIKYSPEISLILNVSKDHKPVEEVRNYLRRLALNSEKAIINTSCGIDNIEHAEYYTQEDADITLKGDSSEVLIRNRKYRVPLPGRFNAENFISAVEGVSAAGLSPDMISLEKPVFRGIKRRFEVIGMAGGITVIDDYAHNPEKIRAAMLTAQEEYRSCVFVFQPHGFKPLKFFFRELTECFNKTLRECDTLILLPVYYAGGSVTKEITSKDIKDAVRTECRGVYLAESKEESKDLILRSAEKEGCILIMGARDPGLVDYAEGILSALRETGIRY